MSFQGFELIHILLIDLCQPRIKNQIFPVILPIDSGEKNGFNYNKLVWGNKETEHRICCPKY